MTEPVKEKQKANYCDYFQFAEGLPSVQESAVERSRKELDDLFRR